MVVATVSVSTDFWGFFWGVSVRRSAVTVLPSDVLAELVQRAVLCNIGSLCNKCNIGAL